MKTPFLFLSAALAVAGMSPAADLVVNGSFELPAVALTPGRLLGLSGAALNVPPGSTAIPGWQVAGAPVSVNLTPYNEGFETLVAGDGLQALDLTADVFGGLGRIGQTVATTPGKDYVLTFQLGVYPGSVIYHGPIRVRVTAGAATAEFRHDPATPIPGCAWQPFALPFHATAAATLIQFQTIEAAGWAGLDRVAVAAASNIAPPPNFAIVFGASAGGGGTSISNDRRFSLDGTIGQPDAGLLEAGGKHLFAGFWGPGHFLHIAREGEYMRVSWDFGLGYGELETTAELPNALAATAWTPVSLAGDARSVLLPASGPAGFFRIREN